MLGERTNKCSGSAMDPWVPRISPLWSAASDDKCQAPSSDEYRDWSLLQLKREIAQRNLKIDQKRRNRDAYVKLLQASDGVVRQNASEATGSSHIESVGIQRTVNPQGSSQEALPFLAALPTMQPPLVRRPAPLFPVVVATQSQPVRPPVASLQAAQPYQVTPDASPQQLQKHKLSSRTAAVVKHPLARRSTPQSVAIVTDEEDPDAPVELVALEESRCTSLRTRKRANPGESLWQYEGGKKRHEHMGHKLTIKAAKVDIETRRLEMESKRDKHNHELQQVHLELAQEQLKQAKLSTQRVRIEWMIEQVLQKKRLRDAGISEQEIGTIV